MGSDSAKPDPIPPLVAHCSAADDHGQVGATSVEVQPSYLLVADLLATGDLELAGTEATGARPSST